MSVVRKPDWRMATGASCVLFIVGMSGCGSEAYDVTRNLSYDSTVGYHAGGGAPAPPCPALPRIGLALGRTVVVGHDSRRIRRSIFRNRRPTKSITGSAHGGTLPFPERATMPDPATATIPGVTR
jgi:hypothetical protein